MVQLPPSFTYAFIVRSTRRDYIGIIHVFPHTITEYPSVLRTCPSLVFCSIGSTERSLYNLPPIARYWAALAFLFSDSLDIPFDLPEIIRETFREELSNTFPIDYTFSHINQLINEQKSEIHEKHPYLLSFLDTFYAESYETLFERVHNGGKLTALELAWFVHETTPPNYQLLFNPSPIPVDSAIMMALGQKFSVKINDSTQILL